MGRVVRVALLLVFSCGEREDIREWTAADHGHQPEEAIDPSRVPAQAAERDPLQSIKALWSVNCASCHGPEGAGDGPGAPPGLTMPNFRDASTLAARTDDDLAESIRRGKNMMPPFGDRLSPEAIRSLVAYVRALHTHADPSS